MTTPWPNARLAIATVALAAAAGWALWQPVWAAGASNWLALELPWLARLLDTWEALLALAVWWVALREPRCGPGLLILWGLYAVPTLLELSMGWFLGASLALLTTVVLVARPWPNRTIMARCAALAGLAIALDAVAG